LTNRSLFAKIKGYNNKKIKREYRQLNKFMIIQTAIGIIIAIWFLNWWDEITH